MCYFHPYTSIDQQSWFHSYVLFNEIMIYTAAGYSVIFVVLSTYIGANVQWHLIGRDDRNILLSYMYIDQSKVNVSSEVT